MKARTAFSPKSGVHGGENDGRTCIRSPNEKDSKPIRAKKTRRVASKARRILKHRRLSVLSRKAALMCKTRRRKRQRRKIAKNSQCHEDSVAQEAVNCECPSVCDKVETNDSDPISDGEILRESLLKTEGVLENAQSPTVACALKTNDSDPISDGEILRESLLKTEGVLENVQSPTVACALKESVAEEVTTVIIPAEVLWLLEGVCLCSTHIIFTANAVSLKISDSSLDSTIMGWPLNKINSFGSYACQQAGYTMVELGLTDSGAEALKEKMEEMPLFNEHDLLCCKGYCITAKICNLDWPDLKRQIMSLSDAYESLWKPLKMEINSEQASGSSLLRTNQLWTLINKESVAEEVTEVIISAGDLLLLESVRVCSSQFSFTADTISLNISDGYSDCIIIKWPLNEINSIGSYMCQQESYILLELGLTDSGAEALKIKLEETPLHVKDDFSICPGNCVMAKINDVDWPEQQRQITSLSDSYKSLWRPFKTDLFAEQDFEAFHGLQRSLVPKTLDREFEREDLIDSGEEEGSNDQAEEGRHEPTLHGWFDIVYPKEDPDAVTVTKNDFLLLNPEEFISDTIIDFYIKYLQSTLSEQDKKRLYFFNSFFFRKLTEIDRSLSYGCDKRKSTFERVKRWTTKVNIFEKDYLFIPIMESAHWSLIIICNPGSISAECEETVNSKAPLILHFDSMAGCHNGLEEPFQNYLMEAWMYGKACECEILPCKCKRFSDVKYISAQVPQQTNYSDCGLFLLHYVELFIREVQAGNSTQFVTCEWFNPIEASDKRVDIQNLILRLRAEELDERGVVFGCLDFQDNLAFSRNNGGVSADGTFLVQEVVAVGNRDQASISNDFERMNMFYNNPVEQMGGAIYSGPLNCSSQMCMDIFNRDDHVQHDDSMLGIDLYSSLSLDVLTPSYQLNHNGSYKQLFMMCHSGAAKFSLEYAREGEDFNASEPLSTDLVSVHRSPSSTSVSMDGNNESGNVCDVSNSYRDDVHETAKFSLDTAREGEDFNASEPVSTNPESVDLIPNSSNISMDVHDESGNVCNVSNSCHDDVHETVRVPHRLSMVDLEGISEEMTSREMWISHAVDDRINQSPDGCKLLDLALDSGMENIEPSRSNMEKDVKNDRSIKDSHISVCQEGASKDSRPPSIGSPLKLNVIVCLNRTESKGEILTDRNPEEDESLHNKDVCRVIASEDIISIRRDFCGNQEEHTHYKIPDQVHDEDLPVIQNISRLENAQYTPSADMGQCTRDEQAQPGLEIENMLEVVKVQGFSKDNRPTSTGSPLNLSTVVCASKAESTDETRTDRNHKEDESLLTFEVIASEDIVSIHRDLSILKEEHICYESPDRAHNGDLPVIQNILKLKNTQCMQSHVGHSTPDYQAQPGLEVEDTFQVVKIAKKICRKKSVDGEILEFSGRRPITRSAKKRIEDKPVSTIPAQKRRKRKSLTEAK